MKKSTQKKSCFQSLKEFWHFNPVDHTGALDVIVVQDEKYNLRSSLFHLKISKSKVFYPNSRNVDVYINGHKMNLGMKLSYRGIAYFEFYGEKEILTSSYVGGNEGHRIKKQRPSYKQYRKVNTEEIKEIQSKKQVPGISLSIPRKVSLIDEPLTPDFSLTKDRFNKTKFQESKKPKSKGVELSLCGNLITNKLNQDEIMEMFDAHRITYDELCDNPKGILRKNLMIKIDQKIYDINIGIPQLLSQLTFNKNLNDIAIRKLMFKQQMQSTSYLIRSKKPPDVFFEDVKLKEGINPIVYRVRGNFGKIYEIKSRLFFYTFKPQFRVIISDVDGTITKSDVFGHILPRFNIHYSHKGIAELYTKLQQKGYILVYLTSRNIGQAKNTQKYLKSIRQKQWKMPEGPLITSPDSLYDAINRELIQKTPEKFKINVIKEIKSLFQFQNYNPIYAGFGNKSTDALAYVIANVNDKRIFITNDKGEIFQIKDKQRTSYAKLAKLTDMYFPLFNENIFQAETMESFRKTKILTKQDIVDNQLIKFQFRNLYIFIITYHQAKSEKQQNKHKD